jgi:transposase-like protein
VILLVVRRYLRYGLSYRDVGHRCERVEAAQRHGCGRFFEAMLVGRERPREVATDLAAPLLRVVDELLPDVFHDTTPYGNNRVDCDHGPLKARRPMRGLRTDPTASIVIRGHAFIQNARRSYYELGVQARHERLRVAAAFDELTTLI